MALPNGKGRKGYGKKKKKQSFGQLFYPSGRKKKQRKKSLKRVRFAKPLVRSPPVVKSSPSDINRFIKIGSVVLDLAKASESCFVLKQPQSILKTNVPDQRNDYQHAEVPTSESNVFPSVDDHVLDVNTSTDDHVHVHAPGKDFQVDSSTLSNFELSHGF